MKSLPILILLAATIVFTSCSKDEEIDPLSKYYGSYLASESISDEIWRVQFSAGENPGEIFIEDGMSDVDEIDLVARVEGSNLIFDRQPFLETFFVSGTGTVEDGDISCRITMEIGLVQISYEINYEKL